MNGLRTVFYVVQEVQMVQGFRRFGCRCGFSRFYANNSRTKNPLHLLNLCTSEPLNLLNLVD